MKQYTLRDPVRILALWIIFQLLIIGGVGGLVDCELNAKTYTCSAPMTSVLGELIIGMVFPLVLFAGNALDQKVAKYCEGKAVTP